jgi:hypothetical protein
MEKKNSFKKCFKYKFSPILIVLSVAIIVLCMAGIGVSLYRIVQFGVHGFYDALKSPFLSLVCILCIAIVIGILIKSQYVITEKKFIVQFGFIRNSYLVKDITAICLNYDSKKITVYFGEQFTVLTLHEKENDEFVKTLREVNNNIDYSFTSSK